MLILALSILAEFRYPLPFLGALIIAYTMLYQVCAVITLGRAKPLMEVYSSSARMSNLKLVVCVDWSIYPPSLCYFQLVVSWTGHLVIYADNLIDFIDDFNVTVKWIETLFPESKTEVDKIYSDVQSFGKAMQSNFYSVLYQFLPKPWPHFYTDACVLFCMYYLSCCQVA